MRVSCAGVSMGSIFGVLAYTTAQLREIALPRLERCAVESVRAALDQATHNYLMLRSAWADTPQVAGVVVASDAWAAGIRRVREVVLAAGASNASADALLSGKRGQPLVVAALPLPQTASSALSKSPLGSARVVSLSLDDKATRERGGRLRWGSGGDVGGAACVFHGNFERLRLRRHGAAVGTDDVDGALVVNEAGQPFAVVHQYTSNRHPPVMRAARRRYDLD